MKWLIIRLPFMSFGSLSFIASIILSKIIEKILDETILGIKIAAIEYETNSQVDEVNEIVAKLKSPKISKTEKEKLDAKLEQSIIDLIKFS